MPKLPSIAEMALELAMKSKPKKVIQGTERQANLNKFLKDSRIKRTMYHGTGSDIEEFKPNQFFAFNPNHANSYAEFAPERGSGKNPNVVPVHVNINNPARERDVEEVVRDLGYLKPDESYDDPTTHEWLTENQFVHAPKVIKELQNRGFDSALIPDMDLYDNDIKSLQVFDPKNVKSAIGNQGTFNPNEPDITKANGGVVNLAGGGNVAKMALELAVKNKKIIQGAERGSRPNIIIPSKLSNVKEAVRKREGDYGARRVERASDEIPNLEKMYQEEALKRAFTGDNAKALMTINPKNFEKYATPLPMNVAKNKAYFEKDVPMDFDQYIKHLSELNDGFSDVPFLEINKKEQGSQLTPFISGHEGRHRSRALANSGEENSLVQLFPRAELREPFPRRSQEEYIDALKKELEMTGNMVRPESEEIYGNGQIQQIIRKPIQLPDIYANGGRVHLSVAGDAAKQAVKQGVKVIEKAPMIMKKVSKSTPELQEAIREMKKKGEIVESSKPVKPEFIQPNPKVSQNPAGYSRAQFEKNQQYQHNIVPTHQFSEPEMISPESIEGHPLVLISGDRTIGGAQIVDVNGNPLTSPAQMHAGASYGHEMSDKGIEEFWAYQLGAASGVQNKAIKAYLETGKLPLGIYTAMGPETGNYSLHNLDVALKSLYNKNPSNTQMHAFNSIMKQGFKKGKDKKTGEDVYVRFPDFVGIENPEELRAQLESNPEMRKFFINRLEKEKSVSTPLDLPEGMAIRHAITEPALRDVPTGTTGYTIGALHPESSLQPNIFHPTYDTSIPGNYLGRMELQLPYREYFPTNYEKIMSNPEQASSAFGTLQGLNTYETVTPEMVDRLMKMNELIKTGRYKDGGLATGGTPPESSVTIEGVNYEPEATYTDPMGMTVPSQDEMRLAISKQNMSPMPYSEPYSDPLKSIRDPRTGAIVKSGIEKVPSNEPEVGGMTPIDFDNLPKERTIADRIAGALETGTTLGTGMLAFPYAFGKGLISDDFNKTFEDTMANNMYIPRDEGGIENLELLDKALRASMLPPIIPEIGGLEPIISAATKRGLQLGAKGVKEGVKTTKGLPVGLSIKDVSNLHPNVKAGIERGDIHPDDAQWMSDYAYTEGNPSVETGSGAYADQSEKMQNFIGRMERGEIPIPEHLKNKVRIGGNSSGLNPNKITTLAKTQAFSPKDEFGFYSKVEKAAKNLQRKKGDGNAFLNDMKRLTNNSPELEDSGMAEFLKNNKNLTKEDIIGFAQRNRPKMKQQTLSKEMNISLEDEPNYYNNLVQALGRDEDLPRIYDSVNVKNNGALIGNIFEEDSPYSNYYAYSPFADDYESFDTKEQAIKYLKDSAENYGEEGGQPLYENTSRTAGGSNYREMLVQLPEKNITQGKLLDDMARRLGAKNFESLPMEQRHELARLAKGTAFTKGHYQDFPNTMINMRMDDRIDVDGKKGTLLDELQSDWHQKGKEEGYASDNPFLKMPQMSADEMLYEYGDQMNPEQKQFLQNFIKNWEQVSQSNKPEEIKSRMLDDRAESFQRWVDRQKIANAIPDAPYKKNWYELGLKKAIQQSVERGDDRLYMSTGETLADRYSLEKHFDNISVNRNFYPTGEVKDFTLHGVLHNGQEVTKFLPDLRDLDSHVGKEMAEKIKDDFANKSDSKHNYSGLDLRVGGEGMRKYYDEIYPSFLKKFAKKYGGHVGETEVMIAPPSYRIVDNEGKLVYSQDLPSKEHAESIIDALYPNDKDIVIQPINARSQKVYYYEPSPEAKKKIMGGLPYKKGGVVKMAGGGSMESDPSLPLRAHLRNFQTPDLLDIQDYGVSAQDNGDAFTLGRQIANKNAEEENPNLRYRASQDYAQYSTPMHRGMLNARVMKNPEQPSIQAMLQYMQEMGGGTAGVGLMGNRTPEGDKLRALQMMYNKRLSDTSDISGAMVYPFGQKPQFNVQYRKRFSEGGSVAEREIARMKEITEKAMLRRELEGSERFLKEFNSSKPTAEIKPIQPVNEQLVNQEYSARRIKPTVALEPIGKGGSRIPSTQLELFKRKGGMVNLAGGGIVDALGNFAGYDATPPETQQTPKPQIDAFQEALRFVLPHEGGYNSVKGDKPTNYGITQDVYSKYIGRPASIDDMKNMPVEHAHEIYRTQYWNPLQKHNLDIKPAVVAFDAAVNQGPTFANNMVKRTQGDIEAMMEARQKQYADIIKKNPKKAKFKAGWDNRMADLKNYAMEDLYAKGGNVSIDDMKLALTRKR